MRMRETSRRFRTIGVLADRSCTVTAVPATAAAPQNGLKLE